jgi:hypothetical protein
LLLASAASACQPLYGGKPENLVKVPKKKAPPPEPIAEVKIPYIEDCTADFRGKQTGPSDVRASETYTQSGEAARANANKSKDPAAQASLYKDAVDKYRTALVKDPFNAEATLGLAIAYDSVYRKGCAIAMLKRLAALGANPTYGRGSSPHNANAMIDSIDDNAAWFKGYRKDANAAVGH